MNADSSEPVDPQWGGEPVDPQWGAPYGRSPAYLTPDRGPVWMRRGKRNRVRFFDLYGIQVGPEQSNVAPAAAYAFDQDWTPL